MPRAGYATLVIEDAQGKRVRNLVSETPFAAGQNTVYWDGLDDLGRDADAARHGLYHVPGALVTPGTYTVRGLTRDKINLRYAMSVYNAGSPPWETADHTGAWLANHTPPQSALYVPDGGDGKPAVLIGSFVTEGGAGLAWLDPQSGRKINGRGWIGGAWTAAPFLARDSGSHPTSDAYAFVGSTWSANSGPAQVELRLTALTKTGDRAVAKINFTPPKAGERGDDYGVQMGGLAVRNGLVAVSLPKINRVLFCDAAMPVERGRIAVPDARGLVFDAQGRLLVLSSTRLLRYALPASLAPSVRLDTIGWTATASVHAEDAVKALDADAGNRWSTNGLQAPGQWFSLDMGKPQTVSTLVLRTDAQRDSPVTYEVAVSDDGQNFRTVARGSGTPGVATIVFPRTRTRYLKLTQTGSSTEAYWSINSLAAFDALPAHSGDLTDAPVAQTLVAGLQDPQGIALDAQGDIYISDRGHSHQVKVFSATGKLLRVIGKAGAPGEGTYDPRRMTNPHGLTIDGQGHLWVAENDFQPKRVSQWNTQSSTLMQAFYGPSSYGGGGELDARDDSRFLYAGMTFHLDWKNNKSWPTNVFWRPDVHAQKFPGGFPQTPLHIGNRQYMTNIYSSNPTGGTSVGTIWRIKNGVAVPVAAMGRAADWDLLKTTPFLSRWPQGADPKGDRWNPVNRTMFVWSDMSGNGQVEPDEVSMQRAENGGITVMPDLSFVCATLDEKPDWYQLSSAARAVRFAPASVDAAGVPRYDLSRPQTLVEGAQSPQSSGGDQVLPHPNGWTIMYPPPKPFSPMSVGGAKNGVPMWSYPNLWPGLHASHESAAPDRPGEIIGATRSLGDFITPLRGDAGPIWAVNGNMGDIYLMTVDGLFVAQLFQNVRYGKVWPFTKAVPGMLLNDISLHDENFWPSITQAKDERVFLLAGADSLVRVEGLDSIRRLPAQPLKISVAQLRSAATYQVQSEAARQAADAKNQAPLTVEMRVQPPVVDGKTDEWNAANFVTIDKRGTAAWFDSNSKPYDASAALAVSGDRLFAAWKTGDKNLLKNSGENLQLLFKTGGALDLQLNTIEGGERLLVTQVKGKTVAMLYRPKVAGTSTPPVRFISPVRAIQMDRVDDVSSQVQLASDGAGNYEISVPLRVLDMKAQAGQSLKGDIGVLRGNGFQTLQRVYWRNKATGITADVPSEAELLPQLWGTMEFKAQ